MAFNKSAIRYTHLHMPNGTTKAVAKMTGAEIKAAMALPKNRSALAPGWSIANNGTIYRTPATQPAQSQPAPQQQTQPQPQAQQPIIRPTNVFTPQMQLQAAQAVADARIDAANTNSEIARLSAGNQGLFNTQKNIIGRDFRIGRHDYNAQSNAAGFRRSGGVNTNNAIMNAQQSQAELDNYNTLGQGAIDKLNMEKKRIVNSHLSNLLSGIGQQYAANITGFEAL